MKKYLQEDDLIPYTVSRVKIVFCQINDNCDVFPNSQHNQKSNLSDNKLLGWNNSNIDTHFYINNILSVQ